MEKEAFHQWDHHRARYYSKGCVPWPKSERYSGQFSAISLLFLLAHTFLLKEKHIAEKVRDVCTYGINNLRYIHPDAPVHVAMEKMIAGDVRHLFILSSSKLEEVTWPNVFSGLISIRDIIKFSKDQDKAVVTRLEDVVSIKNVKATEREY